MTSKAYDRAVVEAAHHASPIFAARGWTYGGDAEAHIPDSEAVELDDDGFGEVRTATGRWHVIRTIDAYTFDPSDDDIHIMLEMGTIEDQKIPKATT